MEALISGMLGALKTHPTRPCRLEGLALWRPISGLWPRTPRLLPALMHKGCAPLFQTPGLLQPTLFPFGVTTHRTQRGINRSNNNNCFLRASEFNIMRLVATTVLRAAFGRTRSLLILEQATLYHAYPISQSVLRGPVKLHPGCLVIRFDSDTAVADGFPATSWPPTVYTI